MKVAEQITPLTISAVERVTDAGCDVAVVFITRAPTAEMKVIRPAAKAVMPKPTCSSMASRNGVAPGTRRKNAPPSTEAWKVGILKIERSIMACGLLRAWAQ